MALLNDPNHVQPLFPAAPNQQAVAPQAPPAAPPKKLMLNDMGPEELEAMDSDEQIRMVRAQEIQDIVNRKQALQEKNAALADYASKAPEGDPALTELLTTAADTWSGTNLAKNLKPDPSLTQAQNVEKLRAAMLKEQEDLSQAQRDLIKQAVSADMMKQRLQFGITKDQNLNPKDMQHIRDSFMRGDHYKLLNESDKLKSILSQYRDKVVKNGVVIAGNPNLAEMESLASQLATGYNKVVGLGALAGQDLALIRKVIPEATIKDPVALFNYFKMSGVGGIIKALDSFDNSLTAEMHNTLDKVSAGYPAIANERIVTDWGKKFSAEKTIATKTPSKTTAAKKMSREEFNKTYFGQ
jgi:hypothetical protein